MNCQRAREYFAELLDTRPRSGDATPAAEELATARAHLATCPDCQREFAALSQTLSALDRLPTTEPSSHLRRNFYAMLEEEKHSAASARQAAERAIRHRHARWWRWFLAPLGAAALVAVGFLAGQRSQPAPIVQPTVVADAETKRELHELQAKMDRMETMNQLIAASFERQQQPANERLRGVLTSATQENPSTRVINELITSLALDTSANVRLQALEALYPHADQELVRTAVLTSLPRENSPLVQVAMIDFLAAARDHEAKPALENMAVSQLTDGNVREAAKRAIAQL